MGFGLSTNAVVGGFIWHEGKHGNPGAQGMTVMSDEGSVYDMKKTGT